MDAGARFMDLHRSGTFVMVNVADAGTAKAVVRRGRRPLPLRARYPLPQMVEPLERSISFGGFGVGACVDEDVGGDEVRHDRAGRRVGGSEPQVA